GNSTGGDGGAIRNENGTFLTVTNCTFSANSTSFSHGGGAIANGISDTLMVTNCTFSGNSGGAITNNGTTTVANSTFSGNSAYCVHRAMANTDSGASRTPIPAQAEHRFRRKPNTDSGPLEHPERAPVAGRGNTPER